MIPEIKGLPVILDTDAANEADDQFAIAYAALSPDVKLETVTAAPFVNSWMKDPSRSIDLSMEEACRFLDLADRPVPVLAGARSFMPDPVTPVDSPAARYIIHRLRSLPAGEKAAVCAIGCGTNAASALLMAPDIADRMILVWQAGHAPECPDGGEFNLCGDVNAARAIFASSAELILIPAYGVSSVMGATARELSERIAGKNPICDALYRLFCDYVGVTEDGCGDDREKIVWDIASVGLIAGCNARLVPSPRRCRIDGDDYCAGEGELILCREIGRAAVYEDMYRCIGRESE